MKILVIGPFTKGDVEDNMRRMKIVSEVLTSSGHLVYAPAYFGWLWYKDSFIAEHEDYDYWMKWSSHFMDIADAVYRIDGESNGADIEEDIARKRGLIIYKKLCDVPNI